MKRFTYPAVVYNDEELFAIVVSDLNMVASGATIEEAFEEAQNQLEVYLNCAIHLEYEIPSSSKFEDVAKSKSKYIVLLVSEKAEERGV